MSSDGDRPDDFGHPTDMRRLSRDEIAVFKQKLRQWQDLDDVHDMMSAIGTTAQFYTVSQGGLKVWRETFIGMSCARLSHARRLRLGDDPPDFELDYGDHTRAFEIVSVWPAGWQPGKQYDDYAERLNAGKSIRLRTLSFAASEAEANAVAPDLTTQIQEKLKKTYPPETILVADIQHDVDFATDSGVKQSIARVARSGLRKFSEVWVRKNASIVRVTPWSTTQLSSPWSEED